MVGNSSNFASDSAPLLQANLPDTLNHTSFLYMKGNTLSKMHYQDSDIKPRHQENDVDVTPVTELEEITKYMVENSLNEDKYPGLIQFKMCEEASPFVRELARMNNMNVLMHDSEIWDVTRNDGVPSYIVYAGRGRSKHTRREWPRWLNNAFCQRLSKFIGSSIRYLWRASCSILPRRASRFLKHHLPELAVPSQHSFRSVMGDPIPQTNPSTCSPCSITVIIEGVHRIEYEWIYGPGTFPLRVSYPRSLIRTCVKIGSLSFKDGSYIEDILDQIMRQGGVPTTANPRIFFLPVRSYERFSQRSLAYSNWPEYTFAKLFFTRGPCIGSLWVENAYFDMADYDVDEDDDQVYRGCSNLRKLQPDINTGCHAVALYAYKFVGRDLRIRVLDNQDKNGPRRWVLFKAFDAFYFLSVDSLPHSPEALRH